MSYLKISPQVYNQIISFAKSSLDCETGGFLYGRVNPSWVYIGELSGPGPKASKTKYGVLFDREYILHFTQKMLEDNFYVIGTWHTHPPNSGCHPSQTDFQTMISFMKHGAIGSPYIFCITCQNAVNVDTGFFTINASNRIVKIKEFEIGIGE